MKKGFTLIELLAVIVILAIIALIATPIILGIINDAREESNERSVELYASAVRNGIAAYQLREGKEVVAGTYNESNPLPFEPEYDGKVDCENVIISETGKVSLDKCTVNDGTKEYSYGMEEDETTTPESTQVYKPQYYSWSSGSVGGDLPSDAKPTVAELNPSYPFYLGLDVDADNKVSAAYACFTRNDVEYCLKSNDFAKSTEIIKDAYADVVDTNACSFDDFYSSCLVDGLSVSAYSYGSVSAYDGGVLCSVSDDGRFACNEV